jgi:hypothetical protein
MIYYLDDFFQRLIKAHNKIATDQRKSVDIVKSIIEDFHPQDEDILNALNNAIRVGIDSPIEFKKQISIVMNKAKNNHFQMLKDLASKKVKNAK